MRALRRKRDDEGTIGILTLGFAVVAIMLILVISAATSVHMTRMRLANLADELAEDASDAVSSDGYFTTEAGTGDVPLAQSRMSDAVVAHVTQRGTDRLEGVRIVTVDAPDAVTARVTVEITVYPLFGLEALMPFADGITVTATGQSRAF
jgi:hypothetical protein